jgi:hypothetical protein
MEIIDGKNRDGFQGVFGRWLNTLTEVGIGFVKEGGATQHEPWEDPKSYRYPK